MNLKKTFGTRGRNLLYGGAKVVGRAAIPIKIGTKFSVEKVSSLINPKGLIYW